MGNMCGSGGSRTGGSGTAGTKSSAGHTLGQPPTNGMAMNGTSSANGHRPDSAEAAERRRIMAEAAQSRSKQYTPSSQKKGVYGDLGERPAVNPNRPRTQWEMENAEALGSSKFDNRP